MADVLTAAADRLSSALRMIDGVRHYRHRFGLVEPPATVLALTGANSDLLSGQLTGATWSLGLVVARSDRSEDQLMPLIAAARAALVGLDLVVALRDERPDSYPAGGLELPAWVMSVDVSLTRFA